MAAQVLDLVAGQVEHGPEILERGEAIDPLARSDDTASQLGVEGGKTCNDLDRCVVEVDEPAVVGTSLTLPATPPSEPNTGVSLASRR